MTTHDVIGVAHLIPVSKGVTILCLYNKAAGQNVIIPKRDEGHEYKNKIQIV